MLRLKIEGRIIGTESSLFYRNWLAYLVVINSVENFNRGDGCKLCYSSCSLELKGFNMHRRTKEIKNFKDSVIALDKLAFANQLARAWREL